jgi:hypothetical protein
MTLTNMITIRLSAEERVLYEAEAAYRKQSLSAYLRGRLEKSETPSSDIQNLQHLVKNITPSSSHQLFSSAGNFIRNSPNPSLSFYP